MITNIIISNIDQLTEDISEEATRMQDEDSESLKLKSQKYFQEF